MAKHCNSFGAHCMWDYCIHWCLNTCWLRNCVKAIRHSFTGWCEIYAVRVKTSLQRRITRGKERNWVRQDFWNSLEHHGTWDYPTGTSMLSDREEFHGLGHVMPPRVWKSPGLVTTLFPGLSCSTPKLRQSWDRAGSVGHLAWPLSPV